MRPTVQQARAALLLSICMTVLGTCGVGSGVAGFSQTSLPATPAPPEEGEAPRRLDLIEAAQRAPWTEAVWESPHHRPLAAANALVSSMLLIGSFLLTFRRKNALWWIRNAVAANVLWIVLNFAHSATRLLGGGPELLTRIETHARLYMGLGDSEDGQAMVIRLVTAAGVGAVATAIVHIVVAWRCHRPDIRAFIESGSSD